MIVKLVKYSVLKCLCRKQHNQGIKHLSSAPVAVSKPLTCQPLPAPKTLLTEIRYEEGKGGLRYEVILTEPAVNKRPCPTTNPAARPVVCGEDIGKKLKAAEERRRGMMEATRHVDVSDKLQRASQKRQQLQDHFSKQTKEILDQKMEEVKENREAHLAALRKKLEEHRHRVETLRLEKQQHRSSASFGQETTATVTVSSG